MRKSIMPIIVVIMLCSLLVIDALSVEDSLLNRALRLLTEGTMDFSVRTVTYNGQYTPENAGVIWITNSQNQFVKTVKIWANTYRWTLIRWIASSNQNMTGAITSASLNSHQLHNITWNGRNWQNVEMPDGEYKVNVEFTEHNATVTNMGKYKQITFNKGSEPVDLTIPNETYFRDMHLTWTPVIVNGILSGQVINAQNEPIFPASISTGAFFTQTNAGGQYSLSLPPGTYDVQCSAVGYHPLTYSSVQIQSNQITPLDFTLAPVSNSEGSGIVPSLTFLPPYPNPATTQTTLRYYAKSNTDHSIRIYNMRGQIVRQIKGSSKNAGWQEINWDLRDSRGNKCPSGIYLLIVNSGDRTHRRMLTVTH